MYELYDRLQILADSAKYDVSCSSSGNDRKNSKTAASAMHAPLASAMPGQPTAAAYPC